MPSYARILFVCVALLVASGVQAAGRVEVSWVQPDRFTDIGHNSWSREDTLKSLGEYIRQLGRYLPDGQSVQLEVTDVDLAGEIEHFSPNDRRVLRGGADVPRLSLRYTLQADGRTVKAGEASLTNLNYAGPPLLSAARQLDLASEKQVLERWFRATFATP